MPGSCSLIRSCGLYGIEGILVDIEVSILPGLPSFDIVGLGDSAVRESKDRVHAAICNTGFTFPVGRLIASYAPAWLRKEGSAFDLPLALAILAASRQIRLPDQPPCVIGELGLNGDIRRVPGVFCRALTCRSSGISRIYVPGENCREARSVLEQGTVAVYHLSEAARLFMPAEAGFSAGQSQRCHAKDGDCCQTAGQGGEPANPSGAPLPDVGQIVGQEKAVRALTIAAAGRHNLLLLGSPGCGKTSLAEAFPGLLPDLTEEESVQVTRIYSASGLLPEQSGLMRSRPFRNPHHAITRAAMIGGGAIPVPGEVSLAHHGVLFLDEMTEFRPDVLDLLRQPMENHMVRLTRLNHRMTYPSDFLLIGAANPCSCGEYLEPSGTCRCTPEKVREHLDRISGPLLDRMDLTAELTRLSAEDLAESVRPERSCQTMSADIRSQVAACWLVQAERCRRQGNNLQPNGRSGSLHLLRDLEIDEPVARYAAGAAHALNISVRGYHKLLRVARTIADLDGSGAISRDHIAEALQYRLYRPV